MTDSVVRQWCFKLNGGCYGHFRLELEGRVDRKYGIPFRTDLNSSGLDYSDFNDYYPFISKHETPAQALRAMADALDRVGGRREQEEILTEFSKRGYSALRPVNPGAMSAPKGQDPKSFDYRLARPDEVCPREGRCHGTEETCTICGWVDYDCGEAECLLPHRRI